MLRRYQESDAPELAAMLAAEGLEADEMAFADECATWVLDEDGIKGMFSMTIAHDLPYLQHFCVKRSNRCHAVARRLVGWFKTVVKAFGYPKALVNVPTDSEYLERLVSRYFRARPYDQDGARKYFFVEV